jgi:hypothetical protein
VHTYMLIRIFEIGPEGIFFLGGMGWRWDGYGLRVMRGLEKLS